MNDMINWTAEEKEEHIDYATEQINKAKQMMKMRGMVRGSAMANRFQNHIDGLEEIKAELVDALNQK